MRMKNLTYETLKIFWRHSTKYGWAYFLTVFGMVAANAAGLFEPFLYKRFFDLLAARANPAELVTVLWQVLILAFVGWLFWRMSGFFEIRSAVRVVTDLMNTCFDYLHNHSFNYFNNNFSGSLVRKVNRYAKAYDEITDQIIFNIGQVAVRLIATLAVLFFRSPLLGWLVLAWSAIFLGFNYWFAMYKIKFDIARAAADTNVTAHLSDTVANNINLKLFNGLPAETREFRRLTGELYGVKKTNWKLGQWSDAVQGAMMIILEFAVMYVAVKFWAQGRASIGDFVFLQSYLIVMFNQLWNFSRYVRRIYESMADANEMTEILIAPHEITDRPNAGKLAVRQGGIEFRGAAFSYPNQKPIFSGFDLAIRPGEKVALIGPSGGGKSTIVKLLFRFFDLQGGGIFIDGQNIAEAVQDSLRKNIALVPQDPILFHRSLLENIRYAKPSASRQEVIRAAKAANCHQFIMGFPDNYDTFVGERGVKLSGGERQRVAIARAILKDAPILVLDEATSSLDSESESLIQVALKNLMRGKTAIVIAHRLSTIMQMDRILVLEKGRITEQGRHEELLKAKQGTYQKLWHIQAGGFA